MDEQAGSKNFSVGYGNGLGPAPARPAADPATRPTVGEGSSLVADPTFSITSMPATAPAPVPGQRADRRSRRGAVLIGLLAVLVVGVLATAGVVASRRSAGTIEAGADLPGGTNGDDASGAGADALNGGNVITLDGPEGSPGTIVLDDGSVMIVLDDGSVVAEDDPRATDPNGPPTTATGPAGPPATDSSGHPVTTTNNPGDHTNGDGNGNGVPAGPGSPSTTLPPGPGGPAGPGGPGPTVTTPGITIPGVTVPGPTVSITVPPTAPTTATPTTVEVTTPPTLGEPPQSFPNTLVTIGPLKLYPQVTSFSGPKTAGCSTFFKGSKTIVLSWTTKYAQTVIITMDGRTAATFEPNSSTTVSFSCLSASHTFAIRAVNSAGSSAAQELTITRS